jgi:hypothetical protein
MTAMTQTAGLHVMGVLVPVLTRCLRMEQGNWNVDVHSLSGPNSCHISPKQIISLKQAGHPQALLAKLAWKNYDHRPRWLNVDYQKPGHLSHTVISLGPRPIKEPGNNWPTIELGTISAPGPTSRPAKTTTTTHTHPHHFLVPCCHLHSSMMPWTTKFRHSESCSFTCPNKCWLVGQHFFSETPNSRSWVTAQLKISLL